MGLIQYAVAQAFTAAAFRNGPLEDLHAGKTCPTCDGKDEYSHLDNSDIKALMKFAVDKLNVLLQLWQDEPAIFAKYVMYINRCYTSEWDAPENDAAILAGIKIAAEGLVSG